MSRTRVVLAAFVAAALVVAVRGIDHVGLPATHPAELDSPDALRHAILLYGRTVVLFYDPMCPACEQFKPTFDAVTEEQRLRVPMFSFDCRAHGHTCAEFGISAYPSTRVFEVGQARLGTADRSLAGLTAFALDGHATEPLVGFRVPSDEERAADEARRDEAAATELSSLVVQLDEETFEREVARGEWLVQFVLGSRYDLESRPLLNALADQLDRRGSVRVGVLNAFHWSAVADSLQLKRFPSFAFFAGWLGNEARIFDGEESVDALLSWVAQQQASRANEKKAEL